MKGKSFVLKSSKKWVRYLLSVGVPAAIIVLMMPLRSWVTVTDVMLLGVACVTLIGFCYGKSEAILASLISVFCVDFLFVQPYYTLAAHNLDYFVSFGVMLAVGVFIAQLAERNRLEFHRAKQLLNQMRLLYRIARSLSRASSWSEQKEAVELVLRNGLGVPFSILLNGESELKSDDVNGIYVSHGQIIFCAYAPLNKQQHRILGLCARMLSQAYANHCAQLAQQDAERLKEREEIRANLLRSIGHDLRTPLGTIMGASSLIMDESIALTKEQYREQATNIYQQSLILKHQIDKMLQLSRIRDLQTTNDWMRLPSADLMSAAFARSKAQLTADFQLQINAEFLEGDGALLEVALSNLIDNATLHGYAPYLIRFDNQASHFSITVENTMGHIGVNKADSGTGLGLQICDAIAKLHNGSFRFQSDTNGVSASIQWEARKCNES